MFHLPLHFIGRDPLVNYINSWLQDGSHDAAIAILYGIGGVGKTTIAKSVFNQNIHKFEGKSFLSNFRSKDIVCLQRQLLSDILKKIVDEINDEDEGILKIKDALCCRKTLIVLDDVDKRDQFNKIIGMQNWLCKGSKIIVTTRNKGLFSANDIEWVRCKVEPLDDEKSLEIFSWNAFGQADPVDGFVEDSWRIIRHCNGLPLALGVIGSSLSGKGREIWESALQQMEVIPNFEVQKVLRISYDFLDGDYPKNLFLDIACFFNGMDVDDVVRILDGLDKGARFGIDNLIDICLVEINTSDQRLWMHQLVRDMGREIARQESPKCQRIWRHEDAFTVLKGTTDAEKLRGLTIDMHALMEDHYAEVVGTDSMVCRKRRMLNFFQQWLSDFFDGGKLQTGETSLFPVLSKDAFKKMPVVKFLQLNYTKFYGSFEHFPKNLIWLCWHGFSSRSIPNHGCLEKRPNRRSGRLWLAVGRFCGGGGGVEISSPGGSGGGWEIGCCCGWPGSERPRETRLWVAAAAATAEGKTVVGRLLLTAEDGAAGSLVRTVLLLLSSVRLASLWRKEQLLSREADREGGRWRGSVEGAAALRSPLLVVAAAVGRSAAAAGGRSVGTAENRLEKTKKKAAGAAAVFGLGEERNDCRWPVWETLLLRLVSGDGEECCPDAAVCRLLLTAEDGAAGSLVRTVLLLLSSVRLASLWRKEQLLSREADREGGRWRGEGAAGGELGVQL
eukprot:XP_024448022.1 disease resistance protein RML1B-like [Populus trichocarpa]